MNPFKKIYNWITGKKPEYTYPKLEAPYVIRITNKADIKQNVMLFGYNDYLNSTNYGSDPGIEITNLLGGTYARLLHQSNNRNFKIGKWRFQSSNKSNLQKTIHFLTFDANGKFFGDPFSLINMKDSFQHQSDIIDVTKQKSIHAGVSMGFEIEPNSDMVISMFPIPPEPIKERKTISAFLMQTYCNLKYWITRRYAILLCHLTLWRAKIKQKFTKKSA